MSRCLHCHAPLGPDQTTCFACGSRAATVASFYAVINEGLAAQGIEPIDPDSEAKERAMYAQLDAQRRQAGVDSITAPPALRVSENEQAPVTRSQAHVFRER